MKKKSKTAWMIYMPDFRRKPKITEPHYVEIQRGKPEEFDGSWREFELVKRPKK